MMKLKVAVVGAGPAGILAAATAAKNGHTVTVFDKNKFPLRKLIITGKGRCNITNDSDPEELIAQVIHNPTFLYSAFYQFPVTSVLDILHSQGVETKVERGGRIFPVSDKSRDVADALVNYAKSFGVVFKMQTTVKRVFWKKLPWRICIGIPRRALLCGIRCSMISCAASQTLPSS